jgi:CelD/BcsL family acetyltransferase involved in cellulose biosynthesis
LKNVARLSRKAEREVGAISLHESEPGPSHRSAFHEFLKVESSGWKGASGTSTSVADDKLANRFFSSLLLDFESDWTVRVFTLQFGSQTVAAALAVFSGSAWHILKIGYNEEFRQYGPGGILLLAFLKKMCNDESVNCVSLITSPNWADRWHFQKTPVYEAYLFSNGLKGRLSKLYFALRCNVASIKAKLLSFSHEKKKA